MAPPGNEQVSRHMRRASAAEHVNSAPMAIRRAGVPSAYCGPGTDQPPRSAGSDGHPSNALIEHVDRSLTRVRTTWLIATRYYQPDGQESGPCERNAGPPRKLRHHYETAGRRVGTDVAYQARSEQPRLAKKREAWPDASLSCADQLLATYVVWIAQWLITVVGRKADVALNGWP